MILLEVQQAARYFGADILFKNVSLTLQEKARVALVGRNGVGKSTLIKMIIGQQKLDEGQIIKKKNLTIGYLAQDTGLESSNTIYDEMLTVFADLQKAEQQMHKLEAQIAQMANNIQMNQKNYDNLLEKYDRLQHDFKEKNGYGYESEIRSVLHGFHFFEEDYSKKITSLSGGQKTRLALAKLLLEKRDLLILDEPTNHLDIGTLSWLENYLQSYNGALLLVSHDRYFLDKIATEVYELTQHSVQFYKGNYSKYIREKSERLRLQWKKFEKQQTEIAKLEDFVDRNLARASTTKRAQSRRKQLEKMERLERPKGQEKGPHFQFRVEQESGNIVMIVENAAIGHNNKIISQPINIDLRKHNIMAIVGPNGVGKSTLLKSILKKIPFIKGNCRFGTNVDVGYYDQELKNLNPAKTVLSEIWDEHPLTPEKDIRSVLGSFLFSGDDVKKIVHNLSGGEKARLLLTKLAMKNHNFLIFDEPTNHLDIDSKEVLEDALLNYSGTVLFVSHDRYFINKVATSVLEISETGSELFLGDYDYYIDKKEEQELIANEKNKENEKDIQTVASSAKSNYKDSKSAQKKVRKLKREVATLEEKIEQLSHTKLEIETQMSLPESFSDASKMQELQLQLTECTKELEQAELLWEEKSLSLEDNN
ncbi:ABC superfamily ATP binding cassette transporter, ABC protein [Liquorilactobacillus aquaticus DSM 21051]|uniref:ABC superfamily ATP binding cassette transporter, ABC protein n=1 Tax=Liquorilactobacillus aquaticus DSM 21051 TaxID=1423725 RepID=A0A0R2CWC6_9LACO|nr:ABC-F family ATP-binding cassette domain-containing protein [Liquorilactobacillus aquaticus]KRM95888.1 ABC superfamily ATP binding cassette transporter, ABC protein [Liquorilactobacillus aquaticus DSM 21051]